MTNLLIVEEEVGKGKQNTSIVFWFCRVKDNIKKKEKQNFVQKKNHIALVSRVRD